MSLATAAARRPRGGGRPPIAFIAWYWPTKEETSTELELEKRP